MAESAHGSGRRALGDLTNVLCKRPATSDLEKSTGGIKIRRIEKDTRTGRKEFDENAKTSSRGKGIVFGHLFDGVAKENFERPSIFQNTRVQHMAAEAAGLLSKEASDVKNHYASTDPFVLSVKEQDSSLESEGDYDDEDNDEMNGELPRHFCSSELANKTNDDSVISDIQRDHMEIIEKLVPDLASLQTRLCPSYMDEDIFWKIYFRLLESNINEQSSEVCGKTMKKLM